MLTNINMKKILSILVLYNILSVSYAITVPVCNQYNQTITSSGTPVETPLIVDVRYLVNSDAVVGGSSDVDPSLVTESGIEYTVHDQNNTVFSVNIIKTILVTNSDPTSPKVQISTIILHNYSSSFSYLKDVTFGDDLSLGLWAELGDGFLPGIMEPGISNEGRSQISWNVNGTVPVNESRTLEYYAVPAGDTMRGLPDGISVFSTLLQYTDSSNIKYASVLPSVCVDRTTVLETSLFYQHGFTALSFFMAFLLGVILVILFVFCIVYIMKKKGLMATAISPSKLDQRKFKETGKKIVLDPKDAMKNGFNSIKDYSLIGPDDSIINVLALKDKLQMYREIDNLDISTTISIDTDLEKEQNDASVQAGKMLIHGMQQNGDISKQTEDEVVNNFNNNMKNFDRKEEEDYKKVMEIILIRLCAKNKEKVGEMIHRHNFQKEELEDNSQDLSEKEVQQFQEILEKQHQTEQNELTYVLALEQNEEAEKLRKEFGMRKRMGIKEYQQVMINEVTEKGRLTQEQADWLIKEHKKQQEAIQLMYDEEISRQRMALEEKLARRRALAQASETQEDDQRDLLNTMAGHQVNDINKLKKQNKVSPEEAEFLIDNVKKDMLNLKEKLDKDKERQENELHKKLSALKQEKLNAMRKRQEGEITDYEKKCRDQQTEGPIDPVSVLGGFQKLRSTHRGDLLFAEVELDNDHSKQLEKARDILAERAKDDLYNMEKMLLEKLKSEGDLKDSEVNKIIKQHERDVAELCESQEEDRRKQQEKLMEELSRRQKEWNQRKQTEKKEQEELREHETKVIGKLINSQLSISEEDRLIIMREHEQNMVRLENSLTLNKLRQKRMLEERLALKRAQQMDKLQQKQQGEVQKQRQKAINNGEEDDKETQQKEIDLMKKHAEQRLQILNGQMLNIDEELDEIRVEMVRGRAIALKNQEERLGTMIANLQLDKAKELSKIEDQQKAINNLKLNLVDDLNERGILSTPECERLLEGHRQQKEELSRKLDDNRAKQEKSLAKKLANRRREMEDNLTLYQNLELEAITEYSVDKSLAKKLSERRREQEDNLTYYQTLQMDEITEYTVDEALKKRLGERVQLREESLIKQQSNDMQSMTSLSGSKVSAKLKRMMLMHKQLLELERFRNQMDREISQTLEENRRQYQVQKIETMQKKEFEFIAKLVKHGHLQKEELSNVVELLFPRKTEPEKQQLIAELYNESNMSKFTHEQEQLLKSSGPSTLPQRVRRMSIASDIDRPQSRAKSRKGADNFNKKKKKIGGRKESTYSLLDSLDTGNLGSITQSDYKRLHDAENGYVKSGKKQEDLLRGKYHDGYDSDGLRNSRNLNNSRNFDKGHRGSHEDLASRNYDKDPRLNGYDNYGRQFDDDDDYMSGGNSTFKSTGPIGRLPPLQPIQSSPPRTKKKKKKLLQKMAHRNDEDYL